MQTDRMNVRIIGAMRALVVMAAGVHVWEHKYVCAWPPIHQNAHR